ncbi:cation transporter [Prevotella scopos JCM 17725]|uniref:Cation diffusion facilitator family transporter n=1 Tax=Prevotella scopos JCM 17725 TaxID=1236518 RepID=A0AAX2F6Z5_9BACT|nr:cation diffusion facilitator family transporter [Prevotella scopos]ANR74113.1 zinc transporter ZitB [Prevotella scopos JCM 17725]QUB44706.1 cation transporter [Prevotella scopos JCM 17725]SHG12807.1 cation diffusion facilitator family transporter [Prevotella scopos JCM 17725]
MSNNIDRSSQEKRTAFVVVFAFCVMLAEIIVGLSSHSMALFADGVHMGSHVLVIGLNWAAYVLVRSLQNKRATHYDTEKVLNLAAFTSGIFLVLTAIFIIVEAVERFSTHEEIFNYELALLTAGIGLLANTISVSVLHGHHGTADYNSHAAYLHVLSDALTEIGAIIGILCAMFWHITWIDSAVAVISALVVLRWAKRLLWDTGRLLTKS